MLRTIQALALLLFAGSLAAQGLEQEAEGWRAMFDGEKAAHAPVAVVDASAGADIRVMYGSGAHEGKPLTSFGLEMRYGFPIAGGAGGTLGPTVGDVQAVQDLSLSLIGIAGASYQSPALAVMDALRLNLELGGRMGRARRTIRDEAGNVVETMNRAFVSAYTAANVLLVDQVSLHLEFSRLFLKQLQTSDPNVGSVGLQFHFDSR